MKFAPILATAITTGSLLFPNAVYPAVGIVTEVNSTSSAREVYVKCVDGFAHDFEDVDFPWWEGDICAMLVSDNGTVDKADDEVMMTKYVGSIMDFIDIFANAEAKGEEK